MERAKARGHFAQSPCLLMVQVVELANDTGQPQA